ncbi:MAG: hypothetical protein HQL35_14800 [Alphaproteobacteria bacterium]|nr:hypothetical protein [Alphaproteobacteria bacterium]
MQRDMHYYGTYAMARAAGLTVETARVIATAAQYVDDNANEKTVRMGDGARIDVMATAHHTFDTDNIDEKDQRHVWVPFHFLPGNKGASYTERLMCRKDGEMAREMVTHALAKAGEPYAVELMGVTAHVYADTFSHYGFSGISSRRNRVDNTTIELHGLGDEIETYIRKKADEFFIEHGKYGGMLENFRAFALDAVEKLSGALGHGSVATYPDRPYLEWSFKYEDGGALSKRDNRTTFLEGCAALHDMFSRFAAARPDLKDAAGRKFSTIEGAVKDVLAVQADCDGRIEAWREAVKKGRVIAGKGEYIPGYDEKDWHKQCKVLAKWDDSGKALSVPVFRFYQAAAVHRTYVLRELMPAHGLVID